MFLLSPRALTCVQIARQTTVSQIMFGLGLSVFAGRTYCRLQVYATRYQNWLAEICMWQLSSIFLIALLVRVDAAAAVPDFGGDSIETVGYMLLFILFSGPLWALLFSEISYQVSYVKL